MPMPKPAETPGGAFLLAGAAAPAEPMNGDAQALGQAARDFMRERVLPRNAQLEAGNRILLRELLREAGKLGLLGCEIPTRYGGLGAPPSSANAVVSGLGLHASFAVSAAAHLTIGAVPLLRHASPALCAELLPAVASGERIGAYALTEPASGSDALHLSTRAVERGGRWAITGAKQFITNAAIADQFVVFALVEGVGPTAFLLDARTPGLQLGKEERKLGLHGSSTCALHLDGAEVPAERVIGAIGHGHRVALDALTVGRHKLGVLAAGHLELLLEVSAVYAGERRQFGRPIGELALVADLLAESIAHACVAGGAARAAPLCAPEVADLARRCPKRRSAR